MIFNEEDAPLLDVSEPLRSEPRGFAPEQMIRCEVCLRGNPPTRTSCLYCAAQLPTTEINVTLQKPTLRPLETWEQGFNLILVPGSAARLNTESLDEMAELLRLKLEDLKRIVEAGEPLPIARATTFDEASLIERKLKEMDVRALVVADSDLDLEEATPKRARAFEVTESELCLYQTGGNKTWSVPWEEISLLVLGRHFVRQIEVEERRVRRAENEIMDAREMSTDEAVLDIYTRNGAALGRIIAGNFDFSGLGAQKKLVAAQNFSTLVELLRTKATAAVYDDSYNRVRPLLVYAWPLVQETESRGWRRKGPGRVSIEAVTRSDNEIQFTRYSRLRHYLLLHQAELKA